MDNEDHDWALIGRCLAGEHTPEDAVALEQWIAVDPQRRRDLERMRVLWEASAQPLRARPPGAALRRVMSRAGIEASPAVAQRAADRRPAAQATSSRARWFAAAAVVVLAAGALLWYLADGRGFGRASPAPMREFVTAYGERASLRLADGSEVLLSPDSRLGVPQDYGRRAREVYLDGLAHFTVAHGARRPFRVHAPGLIAEDIGTQFVVRARADHGSPEVAVVSGQVAVRPTGDRDGGVALSARQVGRVEPSGLISVDSGGDLSRFLAWTQGRLEFHMTPLVDVCRELERWYDLRITIADSALAAEPVTATFADHPIDEVLHILARSLGVGVQRRGRDVRFGGAPLTR